MFVVVARTALSLIWRCSVHWQELNSGEQRSAAPSREVYASRGPPAGGGYRGGPAPYEERGRGYDDRGARPYDDQRGGYRGAPYPDSRGYGPPPPYDAPRGYDAGYGDRGRYRSALLVVWTVFFLW